MRAPLEKMEYPPFFEAIESIKLRDPLADFLGALKGGYVEFSYLDVVKSAGHSCPTIAGAYLMVMHGLKELYKNEIPVRGEIRVGIKGASDEGTNGVVANVFTLITGATQSFGFKGIAGNFSRHDLLWFKDVTDFDLKLTNITSCESVEVKYSPQIIAPDPRQKELMEKVIAQSASAEETEMFKRLWQERVEKIFANADDVIKVSVSNSN